MTGYDPASSCFTDRRLYQFVYIHHVLSGRWDLNPRISCFQGKRGRPDSSTTRYCVLMLPTSFYKTLMSPQVYAEGFEPPDNTTIVLSPDSKSGHFNQARASVDKNKKPKPFELGFSVCVYNIYYDLIISVNIAFPSIWLCG
jgi:hypothetical protein